MASGPFSSVLMRIHCSIGTTKIFPLPLLSGLFATAEIASPASANEKNTLISVTILIILI